IKQALVMATGAAIGAAVGGSAGAASAANETTNNYLTAANLRSREQKIKLCQANGDSACEARVKQEYDGRSATNTGELKRSSLIEKQYLEGVRADIGKLLLDPNVSDGTKAQARVSIREINVAINVIDKAPVIRDAAELGLLAVDVATLGEFAVARVLTSSVVKTLVLKRTGSEISNEAAVRIVNNYYDDAILVKGVGAEGKTVLGHYPEYEHLAESVNARRFSIPEAVWNKMPEAQRWSANQKFLDRLIIRGDEILLSTPLDQVRPGSYFARELQYLAGRGYTPSADGARLLKAVKP
ncbi:MAG: hypothetical protein WKG03_07765, partial [Telluria sp.]